MISFSHFTKHLIPCFLLSALFQTDIIFTFYMMVPGTFNELPKSLQIPSTITDIISDSWESFCRLPTVIGQNWVTCALLNQSLQVVTMVPTCFRSIRDQSKSWKIDNAIYPPTHPPSKPELYPLTVRLGIGKGGLPKGEKVKVTPYERLGVINEDSTNVHSNQHDVLIIATLSHLICRASAPEMLNLSVVLTTLLIN